MSEEILFRRAKFGGFNREDVLQYIGTLSAEKGEKEKIEKELSKVKSELSTLKNSSSSKNDELNDIKAELEKLREEISAKNSRISALESEIDSKNSRILAMQLELESRKAAVVKEKKEPEKSEPALSAERLMQDSMAYSERYIKSAELVAGNIKKDTLEKLNTASGQLSKMRETAAQLNADSEKLSIILDKLSGDVAEASKSFIRNDEESEEKAE